jgi:hypothetical protein
MKIKFLDGILAIALFTIVASGFAHTWEPVNTLTFGSLSMSADGRIICAVPSASHPIISTDSGKTWITAMNSPVTSGYHLESVAVSAEGTRIFVELTGEDFSENIVSTSTNQGTNWTQTAFPVVATQYHVACSADGTKVIAAARNGPIYFSTNAGLNCSTSTVPDAAWTSVASSADGARMVAAVNGGSLYFSEDFGATWAETNLPPQSWASVCISSDGNWVGATSSTGSYISSDAGAHWLTNQIAGLTIACSANGTNWIIGGEQLYTSSDGAMTWQTNLSAAEWLGGAVSADGCEITALGWGAGIWLGRLTPSPQLSIQLHDSSFTLSWLLPSTNLVLQQNADVATTNWISVSNNPTLNFTNLQQEVSVPATASNAFFRLTSQ